MIPPQMREEVHVCPAEFEWNEEFGVCVACKPGYYGFNCSKSCVKPFYGYGCQNQCVGCNESLCDVSTGCPISTESTVSTQVTTVLTTQGESLSTDPKQTKTVPNTSKVLSSKFNTTEAQKSTSLPLSTFTSSLTSTTSKPSFFDSYYPILLGIFGVSSLFLIIFTIYVSLNIHERCSKRRKRTIPHNVSVEVSDTYQEIHNLGTDGNIGYDPLDHNRPSKKSQQDRSLELVDVVQSNVKENATYQLKSTNEYSEINDGKQSPSTNLPICKTTSIHTSSRQKTLAQHDKLVLRTKNSSPDNDGYMLPNSGACVMSDVGDELCSSPYTSPHTSPCENYLDNAEVNSTINDECVNVYLTVLPD
ncbi:uncharacterized protein LOC134242267 [Saccostrea cucullata]|uniref:uncharacterized protein LOC134242267 n=1 Tax=Saccostrea cuccullata TaxID=36930 RepID=UPI002ED16EB5